MKHTGILTILIISVLVSNGFTMPLSPESIDRLKASGQLEQVLARHNRAYERGVDQPGSNIMNSMRQLRRDDPSRDETTLHVPVILVDFRDNEADDDEYPVEHYEELLFSLDELDPGSMREWYRENSYDEVDIVGVVVGWVRLPQTYEYYVNHEHGTGDWPNNSQRMTYDAVNLVDDDVDFSEFDNDEDGTVEAVYIVHAGGGAEANDGNEDMIWSHAWSLNNYRVRLDGVWINRYSTEPDDGQVGVFGHELGHAMFGLPDVYDRDYSSAGLGNWSMMAAGSWGGGGASPSHFDAWCKMQCGFIDPTVLNGNQNGVEIQPIENEDDTYILWTGGNYGDEYYLIENRQQISFDASIPGSGLLIYHIDENVEDQNDNEWYPDHENEGHYLVALEQADGNWDLELDENRGDEGDPYPGSDENESFNDDSTPNSRNYGNQNTDVSITNIQLDEGIITCNLAIGEAVEAPDSLYYDDGNPRAFYPNENNWSKVTFTNQHEFELGTISFMPFNPGPNPDASCFIRVYSEDDDHNLEELLWETEIEELEPWNWDDYDENWHRIIIPEDERIQFENRQNFTIVYGPAPGGEYDPDNIEEGDGWWHMIDADVEAVRSFYYSGDDPHEDHAEWHETSGDLFIRAIAGGQVEEEQPEIEVDPIEIEFVLRSDEEEARNIVIRNIGESRLEFDTELNYICDEDNWISWAPHDAEVEVNEEIVIEVTASASDLEAGEYEAELHILSNDPENDNVTVSITMIIEEGYPHIEVTWSEEYGYPDIMDWNEAFNDLQINRNYGIEFTVTNSGNALLVVDEIYIQGADTYNVADDAFEVQPDEQRDVGITFRSDRSGEFEAICYIASNDPDVWEFQIPLHAIIDNHAPEVSREINNRELEEDFESFVIVDLNNVFDDADDDDLEFVAQSNNENLVVEIEDGSRLRLVAAENWFGEATITITADDGVEEDRDLGPVRELRSARSQANSLSVNQFGISSSTPGRDETAETSFDVVVISVNDAPEFVDNPDDVEVQETDLIEFTLTAEDVDLELDEDETLTLTILDDDGVLDRGANFVDNRDGTGDFSWQTDYDDAGEYIPIFRVRDRAGATRAVAVWIVVLNTNRAPEWIQALEPVEFDEDDAERIVVDLDECVSDPDDDVLRFSYEVDEGFNARITNENEFYIQPVENWNGDTEIVITADDGNDGLVSEVLILSVNSINDLPSEFSLISPADNAVVNTSPDVEFTWQASIDVVEDSSVSYNLVLNFNDEDHWYRNLEETALSVSREDLSLDPNLATEIVWWVWADDGMDSLESSEHFQLTVASLSVSDVAGLMPDKLSLGPVSPNPFNSSATIRYQLPEQAHIRLSIYDMNGRQIAELTNGEVEAGYHSAVWNGSTYPAGIYICRMEAGKTSLTRKLVLVR